MKTFRLQYIRCGKRSCRSCPHGPYWYAFWSEDGKTRSEYIGKRDPRSPATARTAEAEAKPHAWDAMLNRRTATMALARTILGVSALAYQVEVEAAFRKLARTHHPDRGGDAHKMVCVEAAYSFIMKANNWR